MGGEFHELHFAWMGFKPRRRCILQLGGEFRALHLVLVYFHVPRLRLVNELGASVRFVGNHATQAARVLCVHPLETWVQRVEIMWCRNSDRVSIYRRWFVLNWPRGLWLFSSGGCILSRGLTKTSYLKNKWLKDLEHLFAKEIYLSCPIKRKNTRHTLVNIVASRKCITDKTWIKTHLKMQFPAGSVERFSLST